MSGLLGTQLSIYCISTTSLVLESLSSNVATYMDALPWPIIGIGAGLLLECDMTELLSVSHRPSLKIVVVRIGINPQVLTGIILFLKNIRSGVVVPLQSGQSVLESLVFDAGD